MQFEKLSQKQKEYLPLIFSWCFVALVYITVYAISHVRNIPFFIYAYDLEKQHVFFYEEFANLMDGFLSGAGGPFYSWNLFLGSNFYASKVYYLIGDPYAYLHYFLNRYLPLGFYNLNFLTTLLKVEVAATGMYFLIQNIGGEKRSRMVGAVSFALSTWMIDYFAQPVFLSFYSFVPWFFLAFERGIKKRKYLFLSIMAGICLSTNYYLFYSLSLFSPAYYLYRYYQIHHTWKGCFRSVLLAILHYGLGVGMSMFVILPAALFMLSTNRIQTSEFSLVYENWNVYWNLLCGIFLDNMHFRTIFSDGTVFPTGAYQTEEIQLYSSCIYAVLLPQWIAQKEEKPLQWIKIFTVLITLFLFLTPLGARAASLFTDTNYRWLYVVMVFGILLSSKYIDHPELVNQRLLSGTVIGYLVILVCFLSPAKAGNIKAFYYCLCMIPVYLLLYWIVKKKNMFAVSVLILMELFANNVIFHIENMDQQSFKTESFWDGITSTLGSEREMYYCLLQDETYEEDPFYRNYVDFTNILWMDAYNVNIHYPYKGVILYDSTYSYAFDDSKRLVGMDEEAVNFSRMLIIQDADLLDFLSVKYFFVTREEELPPGVNAVLLDEDYLGSILVYRNLDYTPGVQVFQEGITYEEDHPGTRELREYLIYHKEDEMKLQEYLSGEKGEFRIEEMNLMQNHAEIKATNTEKGIAVMKIPYDAGWSVQVNGVPVNTYNVSGGMLGFPVGKGSLTITMDFMPKGLKEGVWLSLGSLGLLILAEGIEIFLRRKEHLKA